MNSEFGFFQKFKMLRSISISGCNNIDGCRVGHPPLQGILVFLWILAFINYLLYIIYIFTFNGRPSWTLLYNLHCSILFEKYFFNIGMCNYILLVFIKNSCVETVYLHLHYIISEVSTDCLSLYLILQNKWCGLIFRVLQFNQVS